MARIIVADDHMVVRKGLVHIISELFPSAVVADVEDAESLMKKVHAEAWDLVITDISMPGSSGLDVLYQIRQQYPKLPVLILSVYSEEQYALRVMKAGASGFLSKDFVPEQLSDAINRLLSGKKYISPYVAEMMSDSISIDSSKKAHEYLSNREFEVLKYISGGQSVSDIAARLSLSVTTISTFRSRVLAKMRLKTNADLMRYFMENNLA